MKTAPPVIVNFPGAIGGPVGYPFWEHFSKESDAQAMLAKVQALGTVSVTLIDAAAPGGDYAAFGSYFQYFDPTIRMWQIKGIITINTVEYNIDEMAGDLIDGEILPRPFIDKSPNTGLKYQVIDSTDVQLYWG